MYWLIIKLKSKVFQVYYEGLVPDSQIVNKATSVGPKHLILF